jgi:hypothetical protein
MPREDETGQHGPEMDDTQVEATEALRDDLPPVDPDDPDDADDSGDSGLED